ncbi:MAG TPA: universal stress protein [Hyphomicrobiaceae bacterium]|nr:universal stress protein [Hyphomicrobiaceae bacterium]
MSWKTITTQLSNPRRADVVLSVAGRLAERFEGHLIGLDATPAFAFASPVITPADVDAIISADEARTAEVRTIFETASANRAFVAEWRELKLTNVDLPGAVLEHARASDLIVASQADPEWELSGMFDFPERLVMESGRPVLVVPYAGAYGEIGKRITIAWSGKRESVRAVFDALPLLKTAEAVTLLCVTSGSEGGPGELPGTEIAASLARHGVKLTVQKSIAEDIGVADDILSRIADSGADLLVMGAYGYSRLREMVFGGVTHHILKHMTVPTLMSH